MNPPKRRHGAVRDARRWQVKVREAEAELAHRIAFIETGSDNTRDMSTLTRLRQRLGRIIDRYGAILD
jgi:Mg2+/Co2+ transporter CorB